ncbi:MAG: hypothetical protein IH585_08880 [Anaerolineaceae bacterium]|nr:hypothetical protein [Anaerolineaceae bacterium]
MKNNKKNPTPKTNRITGAAILALLLIMVFVQRTNLEWLKNWWALLFLIPAIASINNSYTEIQNKKGFTFSLASNMVGIIFPIAICVILLLGLNWIIILPVVIIISGFSMLVVGFVNEEKGSGRIIRALHPWFFSWGAAVILVGIITLVANLQTTPDGLAIYTWYGIALFVASLGGLVSAWIEFRKHGKPTLVVLAHLLVSLVISIPGFLTIFR